MVQDVVKELGFLSLGTRFKRIGESLQAQAHALLAANGMDMPAAYFPLLAALDRLGPVSVGELAQSVGVSQPVVSRSLRNLETSGLVQSDGVDGDRRMRQVRLSRQGRQLVQRGQREVWPAIEAAVAQACASLQGPLLEQLAGLEANLAQAPLLQRAAAAAAAATAAAAKPPSARRRSAR